MTTANLRTDLAAQAAIDLADARPGWELIGYLDLALPYWRIRTRLRMLARKPLGPLEEYVLRAVKSGVTAPIDLQGFLGLDRPVLNNTVVGLMQVDALQLRQDQLAVTAQGRELVDDCVRTVSEVRTVDLEWDGLRRLPTAPLSSWLEPRELRTLGLREVPPTPTSRPEPPELRQQRNSIERLVRQSAGGRLDSYDLLDIGGIDRRLRVFRRGVGLAFKSDAGHNVQIAIAVDGRLSGEHEAAFARAGLAQRFGVGDKGLAGPGTSMRNTIAGLHEAAKYLPPQRHSEVLEIALTKSTERLLLVGYALRDAVLDPAALGLLKARLDAGVHVQLGYGTRGRDGGDADAQLLRHLATLAQAYPQLSVVRLSRAHPGVLVIDRSVAVVSGFDWLGHRGDSTRGFTDQRGHIFTAPEAVDAVHERVTALLATATSPSRKALEESSQQPRPEARRARPSKRDRQA